MQGSWRYNNNAGNDNSGLASSTGGNVHAKDDLQRRASGRKPYIRRALLASRLGQVMHLRAHWPRLRRAHLHTRGDVQTHACRHRRQDHRRRIDASGTTASIRLGSSRRRRREHEALSGNRGALLERGSRIAQCWLQGAHVIPFSLFASLLTSSAGALANSLFEGGSPTAFFYRLAWGYLGACAVVLTVFPFLGARRKSSTGTIS